MTEGRWKYTWNFENSVSRLEVSYIYIVTYFILIKYLLALWLIITHILEAYHGYLFSLVLTFDLVLMGSIFKGHTNDVLLIYMTKRLRLLSL